MKTEIVITSNNHSMHCFKGDLITRKVKKKGLFEKPTLQFIRNLLSDIDQPVMVDVGANIGNHSLDFSTYAKTVYSFEPVDFIFEVLKKNVEQNHIKNIVLTKNALSNEEGESIIYIVPDNIGASSLDERADGLEKIKVRKIIGDEYFNKINPDRIDFIKVDVEGHEEEALRGLMVTIKKYKPIIMMEWCDPKAIKKINESQFLELIKVDYTIQVLGNNRDEGYWKGKRFGDLRRKLAKIFIPISPKLYCFEKSECYNNILFIPKNN